MCKILLSIKPEFVNNIMCGTKKYEFRKIKCKKNVDKIIIYSTSPVKKVVGEADVIDIIVNKPETIWNVTHKYSGISKEFFDKYYNNRTEAVAYKLGNIIEFNEPKNLEYYGVSSAPQSFIYL